jgi:hypothetical protein
MDGKVQRFVLALTGFSLVTGCAPVTPSSSPGGRGSSTSMPQSQRPSPDEQLLGQVGQSPTNAGATSPTPAPTTPPPVAPPPTVVRAEPASGAESVATGLVGKSVTVHLTQSSASLSPGPRRDSVKGVVKAMDAEWLVLDSDGRQLYVPRSAVLAIEAQ